MLSVREAHIEKEKCTRESHPASERRYMQRTNQTFRCLFRCTNKPWNLRFFFPVLFFRAYRVYRKPMRVASVHKQPGCSENGVRRISITGLPYVRLRKGLVKTKKRERKKKERLSRPRRSSDHTEETWLQKLFASLFRRLRSTDKKKKSCYIPRLAVGSTLGRTFFEAGQNQ